MPTNDDANAGVVHALPPAPLFTGRQDHLGRLAAALDGGPGVVSLIGLGGAGKTAVAAEHLRRAAGRYAKVFVWSFYVDQDASAFLRRAHAYFAGPTAPAAEAYGTGALYLLTQALADGRDYLIVLDGLERVQRAAGGGGLAAGAPADFGGTGGSGGAGGSGGTGLGPRRRGAYGELEDPLLKRALTRLAMGVGRARCLITTRFPVADLHPWAARETGDGDGGSAAANGTGGGAGGGLVSSGGGRYVAIDVGHLDPPAGRALLRRRGVVGDDGALDAVLAEFGGHALTLDHLGAYLAAFAGGDPAAAAALPPPAFDTASPEEHRLGRVLSAYERALSPAELDLLTRACVFRFGASTDLLYDLFARSANGVAGALKGMARARFVATLDRLVDLNLLAREPCDCYSTHPAVRDHFYRLFADPQKIHKRAAEGIEAAAGLGLAADWERIVNAYAALRAHEPIRRDGGRIKSPATALEAFAATVEAFVRRHAAALGEANVAAVESFLGRVRGPGKRPTPPDLHLVGGVTLSGQPGVRLPTDKKTLDVLEEVIHHSIRAGRSAEAYQVYQSRLGGASHLGRRLGDHARGARILRAFPTCPNDLDLAWFLRGIGELEESYELFQATKPLWAGTPLTLLGRLAEVTDIRFWEHTRRAAAVLTGRETGRLPVPYLGWGEVLVDADLFLIWGEPKRCVSTAEQGLASAERPAGAVVWAGGYGTPEVQRSRLSMVEAYRRLRNLPAAQDQLDRAEEWVLRSSSVEHLIQFHLARGRLLADQGHEAESAAALAEGLHLARRCGFGLYHIDLMVEVGQSLLRRAERATDPAERGGLTAAAADHARGALYGLLRDGERPADRGDLSLDALLTIGATHPRCGYRLGEADARGVLGEALVMSGSDVAGRMELTRSLELETRVRHPRAERTRWLLRM